MAVGRTSVTMFWVSQKPVIMTKTCRRFRRAWPLRRSASGDLRLTTVVASVTADRSQTFDSETFRA
jgi:hypothetical protein